CWSASLWHVLCYGLSVAGFYRVYSRDLVEEKYQACIITSHGEDVESHSHNQETWNEVTPVKRDNTHGAGKSSDPKFVLTGTPSTPHAATSYPPDAVSLSLLCSYQFYMN
nr:hypothetical protein [Tanacetum cinerariifolium]